MLVEERRFSVNLLHANQAEYASRFSSPDICGDRRFSGAAWQDSVRGAPALTSANAVVFCDLADQVSFGTHAAVIGRVTRVLLNDAIEPAPLLYLDGAYRTVLPRGCE